LAVKEIYAKDHRFAVVYKCRECKTVTTRLFRKYIAPSGERVKPPPTGLGWLG
jgi:hypothetical protein